MSSTLDPDNLVPSGHEQPVRGHDTRSLGPSDTSDSGSDLAGPGLVDADMLDLDTGTNTDVEAGSYNSADNGRSVGDVGMDDNSDSQGTGEHMTAGRDPKVREGGDIDSDRIVDAGEAGLGGGLDQAEEAQLGITDEELGLDDDPDC